MYTVGLHATGQPLITCMFFQSKCILGDVQMVLGHNEVVMVC